MPAFLVEWQSGDLMLLPECRNPEAAKQALGAGSVTEVPHEVLSVAVPGMFMTAAVRGSAEGKAMIAAGHRHFPTLSHIKQAIEARSKTN